MNLHSINLSPRTPKPGPVPATTYTSPAPAKRNHKKHTTAKLNPSLDPFFPSPSPESAYSPANRPATCSNARRTATCSSTRGSASSSAGKSGTHAAPAVRSVAAVAAAMRSAVRAGERCMFGVWCLGAGGTRWVAGRWMVQCWVGRVGVRIDKGSIARVGLSLSPTSVYLRESVGREAGGD
jgi:hypothetical protein